MCWIADFCVCFIERPVCPFYKGHFPSNQLWQWAFRVYGDLCPNLLRPTYPYTKCQLRLLSVFESHWQDISCGSPEWFGGRFTAIPGLSVVVMMTEHHSLRVPIPEPGRASVNGCSACLWKYIYIYVMPLLPVTAQDILYREAFAPDHISGLSAEACISPSATCMLSR